MMWMFLQSKPDIARLFLGAESGEQTWCEIKKMLLSLLSVSGLSRK